jgi:hypothetical protein
MEEKIKDPEALNFVMKQIEFIHNPELDRQGRDE